jgi:hypothetical protein
MDSFGPAAVVGSIFFSISNLYFRSHAHFSKLVSTGLRSTAIFTFFASRSGELIVMEFLLKTIFDFSLRQLGCRRDFVPDQILFGRNMLLLTKPAPRLLEVRQFYRRNRVPDRTTALDMLFDHHLFLRLVFHCGMRHNMPRCRAATEHTMAARLPSDFVSSAKFRRKNVFPPPKMIVIRDNISVFFTH